MFARSSILLILVVCGLSQAQSGSAATRPETAATRPARKLAARRLPFPVDGYASVPSGCAFSPDGKLLALALGYDRAGLVVFGFPKCDVVFRDECPDPRETGKHRPEPANLPPAFSPKSDELAYVRDQSLVIVARDGDAWRAAAPIALPFKPGIGFPDPRVMPWSHDGAAVVIADWNAGVHEINVRSRIVRRLDCGTDLVLSAVVVDTGLAVSTFAEGAFRTTVFRWGIAVEWLSDVRILAVSADQASWLVARLDATSGARSPRQKPPRLEIWDAKPRRLRAVIESPAGADSRPLEPFAGPCHASFSADGSRLVTGGFKVVDVRDGRTGEVLCTIDHYRGDRVVAVAISPDGRHLLTMGRPSVVEDDGVVLWELLPE